MKKISLKNKNILITGITGFIGSALVKRLQKEGAKVFGISSSVENTHIIKANITNFTKIHEIIKSRDIQICFHLAGESVVESGQEKPFNTFKINTEGTLNLLEIAREENLEKLIIASSSHVYGKNKAPYKEYFSPKPSRPYETSKAVTDMIAQSYADTYNLPVMIGRFVNIYGPGDLHFTRLVPKTIRAVLSGHRPQMWGGDILREYLYIDDAINAYIKLAQLDNDHVGRNKVFNFGSGTTHTVREVIEKIVELSGDQHVTIEKVADKRDLEIKAQYVSSVKAKRILEWTATTPLDKGLQKTISWYKNYFLQK